MKAGPNRSEQQSEESPNGRLMCMGMAANWREYTWMPSKSQNKHGLLPGRGSKGRNEEGQFSTVRFAWTRDLKPKVKKKQPNCSFQKEKHRSGF